MIAPNEHVRMDMRTYADVPGIRSILIDSDERLWCAVKERYAVAQVYRGRSESWSRKGVVESGPGAIGFGQPGTVHKDLRRDGPSRFQIVTFDVDLVLERARASGIRGAVTLRTQQLARRHPDRRTFVQLHAAYRQDDNIDALTRQTIVAESLNALVRQLERANERRGRAASSRARIRRAVEYIHDHLSGGITLDALAAAAGLDRFHLCRAFREQVGLPPYAYAIQARITRACSLLAAGTHPGDVATDLGFCDQSQLHRHFRRATGMTPGAYAKAARNVSQASFTGRPARSRLST